MADRFRQVALSPPVFAFDWDGELVLTIAAEDFAGDGTVRVAADSILGSVQYDFREHMESHPQSVLRHSSLGRPISPGRIVPVEFRGTARPADGVAFLLSGVVTEGASEPHVPGAPLVFQLDFSASRCVEAGPSLRNEATYHRTVFRGGLTAGAFVWKGRRTAITVLDQENNIIGVTVESEAMTENEGEAIWLLVSFLSGNKVQSMCDESFDSDGRLIERRHEHGNPATTDRNAPFEPLTGGPNSDDVARMLGAFERMLAEGIPLAAILDHLQKATSAEIEQEAQELVIAIHAMAKGWETHRSLSDDADDGIGRRIYVGRQDWKKLKKELNTVLVPVIDGIPDALRASLLRAVDGANRVSVNERICKFFEDLNIDLDKPDEDALDLRNPLLHDGELKPHFWELTFEEQEARHLAGGRLRNLAYRALLALSGYSGVMADQTTPGRTVGVSPFPSPFVDSQ